MGVTASSYRQTTYLARWSVALAAVLVAHGAIGVPRAYAANTVSPVPSAVAVQAAKSAEFIASQIVADGGQGWGVDPANFGSLYSSDGACACTVGEPFHAQLITANGWEPAASVASQSTGDLWGFPILDARGTTVGVVRIGVRADGEMTIAEGGATEAAEYALLWSDADQRALLEAQGVSGATDLELYAVDSPWLPYVVLSASDGSGAQRAILIRNAPGAQVNVVQRGLSLRTTTSRQVVVGIDPLLDGLMARHEADMASGLLGEGSATTPADWDPSSGAAQEVLVTRTGMWDMFIEWLSGIV